MTSAYVLLAFVLGLIGGYTFLSRPRRRKYMAVAEYWVYLPGTTMPDDNALLTRMVGTNPFSKRGQSPIGPSEGLLFSDIRLHIALVLRTRNAHAFRPDLFDSYSQASEDVVRALDQSNSFVKLRYLSEQPLTDKRHLQFLIHAATAVADLAGGTVIYDQVTQQFTFTDDMHRILENHFDATQSDLHVRLVWLPDAEGGRIETRGLVKVGLNELETAKLQSDQRMICSTVLEAAIAKIWPDASLSKDVEVEAYGDLFKIVPDRPHGKNDKVRIMRVQAV